MLPRVHAPLLVIRQPSRSGESSNFGERDQYVRINNSNSFFVVRTQRARNAARFQEAADVVAAIEVLSASALQYWGNAQSAWYTPAHVASSPLRALRRQAQGEIKADACHTASRRRSQRSDLACHARTATSSRPPQEHSGGYLIALAVVIYATEYWWLLCVPAGVRRNHQDQQHRRARAADARKEDHHRRCCSNPLRSVAWTCADARKKTCVPTP